MSIGDGNLITQVLSKAVGSGEIRHLQRRIARIVPLHGSRGMWQDLGSAKVKGKKVKDGINLDAAIAQLIAA